MNSLSDKHSQKIFSVSTFAYSLNFFISHGVSRNTKKENRFCSKHLELLCNGGNVMHYIKTFSLNFWRGMYLKKECNAVFRLLTS